MIKDAFEKKIHEFIMNEKRQKNESWGNFQ